MADDKKKEEGDEGKKKKGLPPLVMIAIGAIVGGAGVVFAVPAKTVEVEKPAPVFEDVFVTHPDVIKHEFNPRQRAGKGLARVSLKFIYKVHQDSEKKDKEHEAFELIKKNWDMAKYQSLLLLKSRSIKELNSEAGVRLLEHDMMVELNRAFFGEEDPIAAVSGVMFPSIIVQ